jgi:beta-lactamase regulating signal transducer with metallopeptidase domain
MNTYLPSTGFDLWHIAGWTMIHFLWLGTLVALAAFLCRWMLRRASANVRYAISLACLALFAALPILVAAWLHQNPSSFRVEASLQQREKRKPIIATAAHLRDAEFTQNAPVDLVPPINSASPPPTPNDPPVATAAESLAHPMPQPPVPSPFYQAIVAINTSVQYLPWLWLIGTPITFALTATGLIGTRRLRGASRVITEGPIAEALQKLAASLRLTRRVAVAVCDRIAAPVLIGILRPIILLPPAALTGYPAEEIEMVLLHELAHVRRWDNLLNLIQRIIESLLFFHPAVWLISGWVRRERETCCDALVVTCTDRPHAYAELLVALAAQMPRSVLFHPAASSAMAAGPLRSRIRRILKLDDDPMLISGKSFTFMLGILVAIATIAALYLPNTGQAEPSATAATDKKASGNSDRSIPESATQDASAEQASKNNLKSLGLALQNYHDTKGAFPAHAQYDLSGKPLLSWRVLILPFLNDAALYDQFHRNEPWDSEHNRKLIERMPNVFKNPKLTQPGKTNYLADVGKECAFTATRRGLNLTDFRDGSSHTILLVEADQAVEWTKPDDWNFDRQQPTAGLGNLWHDHWNAVYADGSVRRINNSEPANIIGIDFTRAGREKHSLEESADRPIPAPHASQFAADVERILKLFQFDRELPDESRYYELPDKIERVFPEMGELIDALRRDPTRPHFTFSLTNDGTRLEVSAPRAVHEQFIKKRIDERNSNVPAERASPPNADDLFALPADATGSTAGQNAAKSLAHEDQKLADNWPAGVVFPSQKEADISKRAWQQLRIKVVPVSPAELREIHSASALKVVAIGKEPMKSLLLLVNLNDIRTATLGDLASALDSVKGIKVAIAECYSNTPHGPVRTRIALDGSDDPAIEESSALNSPTAKGVPRFPSLEDQKLADLVWKRLRLEVVPIGPVEMKRVKALGYDGGMRLTNSDYAKAEAVVQGSLSDDDILVGLHVWPTRNMKDVAEVLNRPDLAELSPLKFYVVRREQIGVVGNQEQTPICDDVVYTGRIKAADGESRSSRPTTNAQPIPVQPPIGAQPAPNPYIPRVTIAPRSTPPTTMAEARPLPAPANAPTPTPTDQQAILHPAVTANPWDSLQQALPALPGERQPPILPQPPLSPRATALGSPDAAPSSPITAKDDWHNPPFYLALFYHPNDSEPMNMFATQFKILQREYPGQLDGAVINVESDAATAESFKVQQVPTYILYYNRKEVGRTVGQQSIEQLKTSLRILKKRTESTSDPSPTGAIDSHPRQSAGPKSDTTTTAPILSGIVGIVPNTVAVPTSEGDIAVAAIKPNSPAPTATQTDSKLTPAESVFVAYDIPPELKDKALQYFRKSDVRSMADDRGRYIVQATQNWHDHFAATLKATSKWNDPAAVKERAAKPLLMKKVEDEDILEWRSVGLSLKSYTNDRVFGSPKGVAVADIAAGSPAAWADIRVGDVLESVGAFNAGTMPEVQALLKALGEGIQKKKDIRVKLVRPAPTGMMVVYADLTLGPQELGAKPASRNRPIRLPARRPVLPPSTKPKSFTMAKPLINGGGIGT